MYSKEAEACGSEPEAAVAAASGKPELSKAQAGGMARGLGPSAAAYGAFGEALERFEMLSWCLRDAQGSKRKRGGYLRNHGLTAKKVPKSHDIANI